jgi:hypothetical protein
MLGRDLRQMADSVREDLQDITAEAAVESETAARQKTPARQNGAELASD